MLIRKGKQEDIPAVFELIVELAVFEKAPHEVVNSPEKMLDQAQSYDFFVADDNGQIVGAAVYFFSYSTWKGKSLYLDDIVVTQSRRRQGIGSKLFEAVLKEAKRLDLGKIHWQVLDWNTPAIEFYKVYNAQFDSQWLNCKLYPDDISLLD